MRDWRQNKAITYDVANIDIIAATQALLDTSETMQLYLVTELLEQIKCYLIQIVVWLEILII